MQAVRGAGDALLAIRGEHVTSREEGDQLKTSVDQAAEGWVLGFMRGSLPRDPFLSEEEFEGRGVGWQPPDAFWTVDALDGTRSFVDGFDGFCVQVAFIERGVPVLGIVHEPVEQRTFVAARDHGAFVRMSDASWHPLVRRGAPDKPWRFVDSVPPKGSIGELMSRHGAGFVECGSFGLKLCRVAEGHADVFAKDFRFKLWDVAPGEVLLREVGCRVGTLRGAPIPYGTNEVRFAGLLATPETIFDDVVKALEAVP